MQNIIYKQIDNETEKKIIAWFGEGIKKFDMLPNRERCYRIAAVCNEEVVGFAAVCPAKWTPSLEKYGDVVIHSIEVAEGFRRQGIGRKLITMLENWACENGFRQIRAWSSHESPEALHMWYAMGYAMCPATEPIYNNGQITGLNSGYYYAKILNSVSDKNHIMKQWYASIYDQKTVQNDVAHIISTVGSEPLNILEVACGSGRISIPLAKAGHTVTGFDIDEFMLARIPHNSGNLPNFRYYKADALSDDWGSGFDVVILSGNVLVNIVTGGDYTRAQELFIEKAASCVKKGGHLYLDFSCVNWASSKSEQSEERVIFEGTDELGTYGKFILVNGEYDSETRTDRSFRRYEITAINGETFSVTKPSVKHFPTYGQVESWLGKYGWTIEWHAPVSEKTFHAIIWARH